MLISKSSSIGDITSFKLTNGDEVVARIVDITNDAYTLSKPCLVVPGQQGIGLLPQAMFSVDPDTSVEVGRQHIMMMAPTVDQMQSLYLKVTTGIAVSTTGIIS